MSDEPQGMDWWRGRDGKWYPPVAQPARNRSRRGWMIVALLAVGGCIAISAVNEGNDAEQDRADNLYACDEARRIWIQTIDPSLRSDPIFRYELASKPLTAITAQFTYDTGVINATGDTDGVKWTCLIDPNGGARWGFDDDQSGS